MRIRPGPVLAVLLALLAFIVLSDLFVLAGAQRNVHTYGTEVRDGSVATFDRIPAEEGDVVNVHLARHVPGGHLGAYEVFVVEGGEARQVLDRGTADHIYRHESGLDARHDTAGPTAFKRPAPPPGASGDTIDIVWVYQYAEGVVRPTTESERRWFDELVESEVGQSEVNALVVMGPAASVHRINSAVIPVLSAMVAGAFAWWAFSSWKAGRPRGDASPSADLVALTEYAGTYLARLRAFVFGLGVPLAVLAWLLLFFVHGQLAELAGPSPGWGRVLVHGLTVVLLAMAGGWVLLAVQAHLAVRRWAAAQQSRPWAE